MSDHDLDELEQNAFQPKVEGLAQYLTYCVTRMEDVPNEASLAVLEGLRSGLRATDQVLIARQDLLEILDELRERRQQAELGLVLVEPSSEAA